jgi:hypothetical protein
MKKLVRMARSAAISVLRRSSILDSWLLVMRRRSLASGEGYPNWRGIIAGSKTDWPPPAAARPTKVLVATSIGSHLPAMQVETMLAAALRMRRADVEILLCDGILPGCQMCEPRYFPNIERFVRFGPQKDLCGQCFVPGKRNYDELGVKVRRYSDSLTEDDHAFASRIAAETPLDALEAFDFDGLKLGEHAKAGALRFFASATVDKEPLAEPVLRRYLKAALLTALAVQRLFDENHYDVAVFHHGIYIPQGVIGEVARRRNVRVVNWNPAYRTGCFLFSHEDTYHHTLMSEPVSVWENMPWPQERQEQIETYLRSRWEGENDWIRFHQNPVFGKEKILSEIGCRSDLPIIGCLTNVMWDAQLHYPTNAFPDMLAWLVSTVRYFANRPDLQLVIRVHPAEIRGSVPTRQPVVAELARLFPKLPENVFVVGPESNVSTYVLSELCDSVIIYGTKTGVELTSVGIPVIVAGEAWIRNKGVTTDIESEAAYAAILDQLPAGKRLPPETVGRALRYAYHFFFRRMIPLAHYKPGPGWPPYVFMGRDIEDLACGKNAGLDCVCDGILLGTPFIHD